MTRSGQTLELWVCAGTCSGAPSGSGKFLAGRLTRVTNGVSTADTKGYDALGRVLVSEQTTGRQTYGFSYSYYPSDGLKTMTYPSTRTVSYAYDEEARRVKKASPSAAMVLLFGGAGEVNECGRAAS